MGRSSWRIRDDVVVRKTRAAVGSFVFLLVAPGLVAGAGPWLVTRWTVHDWSLPARILGGAVALGGFAVLIHAFVRFAVEGLGTPAPVAPTETLVVGGAYRWVRNPMYLAVAALIVGQALLDPPWVCWRRGFQVDKLLVLSLL